MRVLRNGSKELIKEINRFKVLNIIRHQHPISRGEISKQYKLGVSTLSYIIEDLKSSGLIYEVGESNSTGGRRAKLIEFNKDYGLIISVKIEEKQMLIALTNMDAEIIDEKEIPFSDDLSPESVITNLEKGIYTVFESCDKDINNLLGIGILSSGLVSQSDGSIIRSSMLGWSNVQITNMLQEKFKDVQIFVDNNINGYTLAELSNGEGQTNNNFLVVSIGAGIGLSVVIDRKIYYGALGGAGEFGHTCIEVNGYECHCGQRGCLEMYASEFYFENKGHELIKEYPDTKIMNYSFSEVAEHAEQGDELAKVLVEEMSHYLGYGVRNLINTFNPEKVVLAGEGMKYGHLFIDQVKEIAQENFFSKVEMPTQIVASKLSKESWLTGGALLAINHIFQEPVYENEQTII